ncbi:MAG: transposase [Clostridia bacterium]|nr:transposase [Clostridia bacterium]
MPRKPRYYNTSDFYHIMVQGDEKKYIFKHDKYKRKYRYLLKHNAMKNDVEIISYCIMNNHVHVLVFCPEIKRISKMMLQINTSFGLYYNNDRQKVGHVFRERYRAEAIYTKYHLINCIKYIHENPVKAGICRKCNEYMYSSYQEISKVSNSLLQICDISTNELNNILNSPHTESKFIDDDSEKEDVEKVFVEIKRRKDIKVEDTKYISEIYCEIKKRCKVTDSQIAILLGIERSKFLRMLRKEGIKKVVHR